MDIKGQALRAMRGTKGLRQALREDTQGHEEARGQCKQHILGYVGWENVGEVGKASMSFYLRSRQSVGSDSD